MALCSSQSLSGIEILLPSHQAPRKCPAGVVSEARAGGLGLGAVDVRQNLSPCFKTCTVSSAHGTWSSSSRRSTSRPQISSSKLEAQGLDSRVLGAAAGGGGGRLRTMNDDGSTVKFTSSFRRWKRSSLSSSSPGRTKIRSQVSKGDYHQHQVDNEHHQIHREAFKEAIFELEYMVRDPAEVLEGLQENLSTRDLELVLAYFAQEGRDSWCALEVFDWMQRVNRVGDDTHKLMMRIMFEWIMKLVEKEQPVEDVKSLLQDMNCVGLKPEFHIMQSIIGTYWEKGKKAEALCFVKEMLDTDVEAEGEDPVVFLILKMVKAGEQKDALDLIHHLRGCNFKLKVSAYTATLVAAVVEQEQLTLARRRLREYERKGTIKKLEKDWDLFQAYEESLHAEAEQVARWALEEGVPEAIPSVNERLLAMYSIAGKALQAEQALWGMKLAGREPPWEMYNTVLGICGYRNEREAVFRILRRMEDGGKLPVKKSYSVLMGGFIKGGHCESAADIMHLMLEKNVYPDSNVMLAVLRALQKAELVGSYLKLCRSLAQAGLIEPCLLYFYVDALNLCIIRML